MRIDAQTNMEAERRAIAFLTSPNKRVIKDGVATTEGNTHFVRGTQITSPVTLIQELPFVNTTQSYTFNFNNSAPNPSSTLNNVLLPKNNVAAVYALQILFGVGANANNRQYYSHGFTADDDSMYNSNVSMQIEDQTKINLVTGYEFKDVYPSPLQVDGLSGLCIINPIRILSGEMGIWSVNLSLLNPITTLKLTSNSFISCRLKVVMGQASGQGQK